MALGLEFTLSLDGRENDRVFVAVFLQPTTQSVSLSGVGLQLFGPDGSVLSSRMLLPIAGALGQSMLTSVELKSAGLIPQGSEVRGTAWHESDFVETSVPTDPHTRLESHVRGLIRLVVDETSILERMDTSEKEPLLVRFPWLALPMIKPSEPVGILESEETTDAEWDHLGMDEDAAAWVRSLLDEG